MLNEYPIVDDAAALRRVLPKKMPVKPQVFIFGHGLWNDVNETASLLWLDQVERVVNTTRPSLTTYEMVYPRLFVTPSSAGVQKAEQYIATQGNMALSRFEIAMGSAVKDRGFDHLGVYNLTIQNTSPDGTHAGFRSNLIKAMMVFNWISWIDVGNSETDEVGTDDQH